MLLFNEQRLSSHTRFCSTLLLCVCCCIADQRRHAGLCPRANCCYLADSLSDSLHSHWLPGLQGDSHRHPKTNKPGRTIDNGCKSYRSAQLLIKILWELVRVCVCARYVRECVKVFADCPHSLIVNWYLQPLPECLFMWFWLRAWQSSSSQQHHINAPR